MKKLLLFSLAAVFLLGSARPSAPVLAYDLAELGEWDPACTNPDDCVFLALGPENEPVVVLLAIDPAVLAEPDPPPLAPRVPAQERSPAPAPAPAPPPAAPAPPSAADAVRIVISIPQQKAYVFEGGELVDTSPVSTGKRGHETPAGTFRILQKKVRHHSNLYSNAPMPYMQRLTHSGVALHAGQLPGYPASHGCIRLPWSFAKKLYGMTRFNTPVTITHESPPSGEAALDLG